MRRGPRSWCTIGQCCAPQRVSDNLVGPLSPCPRLRLRCPSPPQCRPCCCAWPAWRRAGPRATGVDGLGTGAGVVVGGLRRLLCRSAGHRRRHDPVPFITMIFTRGFAPGDRPHGHRHLARHDLVHLDVPVRATTCGAVRWRIVALPSPGILLGSWIGPWIASRCRRPCWRCSSACSSPSRRQMLLGKSQRRARAAALSACSRGGLIGCWPGWWGGRRLHLHPLHGLVQCEDPQRRRHQRRARLPIAGRHPSNIFYGWESIAAVLAVSSTRRRWR